MNATSEKYLKTFRANLRDIPEDEKIDIINEIETHINAGIDKDEPIETILSKLGKPATLARSYTNEYLLNSGIARPSLIFSIFFYGFAGLTGIVVVPTLAICAATFAFCGIVIPLVGVTNLLGITRFPYMMVGGYIVPPVPAFIIGTIVGVLLLFVGILCWKCLQKYCRFISGTYHKMRVK